MKKLLLQIWVLVLFIIAVGFFYMAVEMVFITSFVNVVFILVASFFFIIACGKMDQVHGFGRYSGGTETEVDSSGEFSKKDDGHEHGPGHGRIRHEGYQGAGN